MATLAELVKAVGRDSGTLPNWSTFTTLVGASDRAQKIAAWIDEAYTHIQNDERWLWLRAFQSSPLIAGVAAYSGADLGIASRFGFFRGDEPGYLGWSLYDPAKGISDEQPIRQIDYDLYVQLYGRGAGSLVSGRPLYYALNAEGVVRFAPQPDIAYTVRLSYYKSPQPLTVDSDTPEMPTRFHNLIKWDAMRLLQLADGAQQDMMNARAEYADLRAALSFSQLPPIRIGSDPVA